MAKANWVNINPSSGNGDATVNVSATQYTGRLARSSNADFNGVGMDTPAVLAILQQSKSEFVNFGESVYSVSNESGSVIISGLSNSSELTFSIQTGGSLSISLPDTFTADGSIVENGGSIPNDIGASHQYTFSFTIDYPENVTVQELTAIINVVTAEGLSASTIISQSPAPPELTLTPSSVTINSNGDAVTVQVSSNTSWTVE